MQAVIAATVFAILALLLPPLAIISSAVVALVTLRLGAGRGLEVSILATVATSLLGFVVLSDIGFGVVSLVLWLPIWLLALVLRYTTSLSLTVQAALVIGVIPLLIELFYFSSSGSDWNALLAPLKESLTKTEVLGPEQSAELIKWLSLWLTGFFAGGLVLQTCLGLFLARSWQAKLYNPGGFRGEFHALQADKRVAYLATAVLLLLVAADGAQWSLVRLVAVLLMVLLLT